MLSFTSKIEILSMAFNRSNWIDKARNRLEGALGEYAKLRYARLIDFHYDWAPEIRALISKVEELFDIKKTKLKTSFNLEKAFLEAYTEAASAQEQIVAARNSFERGYLRADEIKEFLNVTAKHRFRSEELVKDMLQEFSPQLLKKVKR